MSWKERTESEFTITTGDGREYRNILWKNPSKAIEYNIAQFEFPNLEGSKIDRGMPKGRKFPLEIYFQGENHLSTSIDFELSANDIRPWTVQHPLYGIIFCCPSDLFFDNTVYNVTKITGNLLETIKDDAPKTSFNAVDKISADKKLTGDIFTNSAANIKLDTKNLNLLTKNTATLYNEGKKSISTTLDAEKYFNLFNEANSAIIQATSYPLDAMRQIQAIIDAPALFTDTVKNRIRTLVNQFNRLRQSVSSLFRRSDKKIYEHNAGILVSATALASVTEVDYKNRRDVLNAVENILEVYNNFLADLDILQNTNGGSVDSYIPDVDSLIALHDLITYTVSNLFTIAVDSKQERTIILEDDSNIITLAHRFYGLTANDSTITDFMAINNIGLNELLQLKKGRKITYYV